MIFATPNPKPKLIFLKDLKITKTSILSQSRRAARHTRGGSGANEMVFLDSCMGGIMIRTGADFPKRPRASLYGFIEAYPLI